MRKGYRFPYVYQPPAPDVQAVPVGCKRCGGVWQELRVEHGNNSTRNCVDMYDYCDDCRSQNDIVREEDNIRYYEFNNSFYRVTKMQNLGENILIEYSTKVGKHLEGKKKIDKNRFQVIIPKKELESAKEIEDLEFYVWEHVWRKE